MTKVSFASMKLKVDTNVNTFDFEYKELRTALMY